MPTHSRICQKGPFTETDVARPSACARAARSARSAGKREASSARYRQMMFSQSSRLCTGNLCHLRVTKSLAERM